MIITFVNIEQMPQKKNQTGKRRKGKEGQVHEEEPETLTKTHYKEEKNKACLRKIVSESTNRMNI